MQAKGKTVYCWQKTQIPKMLNDFSIFSPVPLTPKDQQERLFTSTTNYFHDGGTGRRAKSTTAAT